MKKLFVSETPVQVIIVLCLIYKYFNKFDHYDLMIPDTFKGYDEIFNKLKNLNIFDNIYIANITYNCRLNKILKLNYVLNTKLFLKKIMNDKIKIYDELYFWNYDSFTASLRSFFFKKNRDLKTFLFEEGYISYFPYKDVVEETNSALMRIVDKKNKIFYKLSRDNINGMYLFEPNLLLYDTIFPIYKIDRNILHTKEFKNAIKYIFNVEASLKNYDKKFIILEEYHDEYNDEDIFNNIINIVGKDNVIIKLHPRRPENRFAKKGVKTLGNDGIPWEALLIAGDFSDKVIISVGSSSITMQRILFGSEKMNAYLLFKCVGANLKQFDNKYMNFWNKLESNNSRRGIHIPNTLDEFYDILEKEKEQK